MMQALSSAVAGLDGEQTAMNVIGNNIANVNTTGFKSSSADFTTLLSQVLSSGSSPVLTGTAPGTPVLGGTNPVEVGLGVGIGSINQNMAQGPLQQTGNPLDVAIQGNGFLTLSGAQGTVYSRDGGLEIDSNGDLVQASTGSLVEGWQASATGTITQSQTVTPLQIPQTYTPSGGTQESLAAVAIGSNGVITATYQGASGTSNQVTVAQIALGTFPNANGLVAVSGTSYVVGPNSGSVTYAGPGSSGAGALAVGSLEQSNVDISQELTNMIVAERSYQVDAKVITTADTMLQSLIQIQ
ncbi:MAG: flagellar hook-basal body complex protein [Thermaerobacter sp.]|nr:flagellar hook-basal body complex protein [Thermaerobacter sp.]